MFAGAIAIGIGGFILGYGADLAQVKGRRGSSHLLYSAALLSGLACLAILLILPGRVSVPATVRWISGVAALVFLSLFLYSVLLEIPLRVRKSGSSSAKPTLVRGGTYALCRHPGALWFPPGFVFLGMALESQPLLVTSPLWIAGELIWVWLQDRYIFVLLFPGYREYQGETPFLLPSRQSLRAALKSFRDLSLT